MKTKIFTLNGFKNYGNRLQLFALSKVLRNLHLTVEVFWPKTFMQVAKDCIKYYSPLVLLYQKEKKLLKFTKTNIPNSTSDPNADFAIVGSDQVWNLSYSQSNDYLLDIPGKSTKISYAASIGIETLNSDQKLLFRNALAKYSKISVREQSAKEVLQSCVGKKIEVVLDPTLLLDRGEYKLLEKRPKGMKKNERYILCYILGNRDHEEKIEKFAKEKGYKTIYFSDKRDSNYGVEEFLYLIHHAELICTDSFHACVFSFIFERPFVAFRRTGEANYMYTRLQNLIDTFKLKNREFNGKEITKENLEVNYTEAKKILKKEQKKSLDFLKEALK